MQYSRLRKFWSVGLGLIFLLAGCTPAASTASNTPTAASTPEPVQKSLNLAAEYQGYTGAVVLYDQNAHTLSRYNPGRCAQGFLPASTFKILNSLIALETGVLPDKDYLIKWDGTVYDVPSWNQDQTMETAFKNSVVWYYQEVARRIGQERMQKYVTLAGYGNQDISDNLDSFWLDGKLRISADQQVDFLRRFYFDELPFSTRSVEIVKELMRIEQTDAYTVSGKTGSTGQGSDRIAWFVGYVETGGNILFFASNMSSQEGGDPPTGELVKKITLQILKDLQVLPGGSEVK